MPISPCTCLALPIDHKHRRASSKCGPAEIFTSRKIPWYSWIELSSWTWKTWPGTKIRHFALVFVAESPVCSRKVPEINGLCGSWVAPELT